LEYYFAALQTVPRGGHDICLYRPVERLHGAIDLS